MSFRSNRQKLNHGWRFRFEDEAWQAVNLPHTWNALDTMDTRPEKHYRRGKGYYELAFVPPAGMENRRLWLEFEAVAQRAWIYFDGEFIGEHHGGYTAFCVEIPNRSGKLLVIADNHPDPDLIPSDMSDFFLYGGITRNVWLYHTGDAWLENLSIQTDVSGNVAIEGQVHGQFTQGTELFIRIDSQEHRIELETSEFSQEILLEAPHLWSPDNPYLYDVEIGLGNCDALQAAIGFRQFEFIEWGGFFLNGERLLLRGTHRHEDWAGYGGAIPDELTWKELQLIKEAGFNFLRLGHYPQSRAALEACDRLGILVWEELPWCRGGVGDETFKKYSRQMLYEMIEQHRHHPSIILWGLGNELDWESEHPDSSDKKVREFLQELHQLSHELDPSRMTALRRFDFGADVVDVYSPSIWAGWYRGNYEDYEANLASALKKYPRLLHAEWGGDSHAGRFSPAHKNRLKVQSSQENAEEVGIATSEEGFARYSKDGDWSESYILDLMDWHLQIQTKMPNFAGSLQWVFKDFGTPLRPENPIPYVNQKGLLDRAGKAKTVYWLFKAHQTTSPVLKFEAYLWRSYAESHIIRAITNQPEVELFQNGISCGKRMRAESCILQWEIQLDDLALLEVKAGDLSDSLTIGNQPTATKAEDFRLYISHSFDIGTEIGIQLIDKNGLPVYEDERRVYFAVISGGEILAFQGFMGGSDVLATANGQAFVRARIEDELHLKIEVEGIGERIEAISQTIAD